MVTEECHYFEITLTGGKMVSENVRMKTRGCHQRGKNDLREHQDEDKRMPSLWQRVPVGFLHLSHCPIPRCYSGRSDLEEHCQQVIVSAISL